jgi:hypothetical protein
MVVGIGGQSACVHGERGRQVQPPESDSHAISRRRLIARDHFDTSDINQQVYQLYNVDGNQYGFPIDAPSQQFYHNVTAFQEAGQPLPSYDWKDTSWNWEAFVASAQKLVKHDASGHVTRSLPR